jgi:hypothetical protein
MAIISLREDAHAVLKGYEKMESYRIQEDLLQRLVKKYPDHKNKAAVETKVKLLNLFYSTGIQATNKMSENILSIRDIDKRLSKGDKSLIPEIATLSFDDKKRYNYSFATKYCAYHQPEKFPIYDSIVAMTFISFFEKGLLPKYKCCSLKSKVEDTDTYTKAEFKEKLKGYDFFVDVYDYFMKLYDLKGYFTYREIDSYIWGAFKVGGTNYKIEEMAQLDKSKIIEYNI